MLPRLSTAGLGEAIGESGIACEAPVFVLSRGMKSRATDDMMAILLHEQSQMAKAKGRVSQESKELRYEGVTRFRPPVLKERGCLGGFRESFSASKDVVMVVHCFKGRKR